MAREIVQSALISGTTMFHYILDDYSFHVPQGKQINPQKEKPSAFIPYYESSWLLIGKQPGD